MQVSPIAYQICNKLGLSGDYWVVLTQTLINLTRSTRMVIYDYLSSKLSYLRSYKGTLNTLSNKANILSSKINNSISALNIILSPIRNTLKSIPLEVLGLQEIPEVADLLQEITTKVPLKIPSNQATIISNLADFDFLEGVETFADLQDKITELSYRVSRATALSTYVEKVTFMADEQMKKLENILYIIVEINNIEGTS
jgi:hypothetical protein